MPRKTPDRGRPVKNELELFIAEHGAFWIIILGVVVVKWAWSEKRRTVRDWIRHLSVAVLVGGLLNLYLTDIPDDTLGPGTKGAILGLVVLQADHIFLGLMKIGHAFRENPTGLLRYIIDTWRGRK